MKLSPSTIAANLSAARQAEEELAVTSQTSTSLSVTVSTTTTAASSSISSTSAPAMSCNPPRDTQFVAEMLKEMGIHEYEPRVLNQLVEFAYRYSSQVMEDAQLFSSYAKKKQIDTDDVNIALQMQAERSFVGPPSRDFLLEIARHKNAQPLPAIKSHNGLRLPADRYSLVASNLRFVPANNNNKPSALPTQQSKVAPPRTGTSLLSKFAPAIGNFPNKTPSSGDAILGIKRRIDET